MRELTATEVAQVSGADVSSGIVGVGMGTASALASGAIAGTLWGATTGGIVGAGVGAVVGVGYVLATEDDS
ncbi:MAG: hypothetical protein R3E86_07955 [Pseudomonadales bacterium]